MAAQIELGMEIAEMALQEIDDGATPADAFNGLLRKCLGLDETPAKVASEHSIH